MAEKKREQSGGEAMAQRRRIPDSKPDPPNWYAVFAFESSYSKPASAEDLDYHSKAVRKVTDSALPKTKKENALEYLRMGEGGKNGRFSVVQTEAVADKYVDGKIPDEEFDFERRLMQAWCDKRVENFIDQESAAIDTRDISTDERRLAKTMLAQAKNKSDIIMVFAASAARVYYSGADEKGRLDLLSKAMELVESARDRL